ncbi:two-component system response regulator RppA [Chamaesiphon sp. OTE_8_metabat_110]|uniref:two-component system response regulator RppA n=1 Tax=Chamaesiphon sp. OTE_8_metabat_110 TaxID=2964696 RepID=UPI00286A3A30|nr:two-component system response regulator RppA [Chamaesiphon sp. OTE_8_metabat_110]
MKILLIEDEPDLGSTIQKSLSHHQYIVDWAIDGQSGWEYLTIDPTIYALAIVDWMLPKLSGIELCQRLRSHNYTLPILMLTAKDRMEDKITGLDAGADDYLVKPFGMAELLARMRALQRRAPTFKPDRLQLGNMELDYGNNGILVTDKQGSLSQITLTAKEFQLLEYLMQHPNITLTHERIRSRIWSIDSDAASNVVAAQIRLLRKKLSESGCSPTIETIRGFGYRLICN